MTTVEDIEIIVGVDTHRDFHVAVAIDVHGRFLDETVVTTDRAGYAQLVAWASDLGVIDRIGVEGTGSWGRGLTLWLRAEGLAVVEVDRPERRKGLAKSDPIDAEKAARAVLSGQATIVPKAGTGIVEQIRVLRLTRRSAVHNRTQAANQLHALVVTAPPELREDLEPLTTTELVSTAAAFRPGDRPDTVHATARYGMRELARRHQMLSEQIARLDRQLDRLVTRAAPELLEPFGIGTHTAAALLVCAGDNPDRLDDEGSFAHLTGAAPLDASSGRQQRHRLNPGGDRHANSALHTIAVTRLRGEQRTQHYYQRRQHDGKTKREIIRCLKRYIAREVFQLLRDAPALAAT